MLSFHHPWMFSLLLLPVLLRYLTPSRHETRDAVRVPFLDLLSRLSGAKAGADFSVYRRRWSQWLLFAFAWLGLVSALARPVWLEDPLVRELPMRDLLVALDLSGSMETLDFTDSAGQVSDRLTAAKQVLDEFLSRREGDRIGLIFFGSAAFVQAPFTEDRDVVRELLDEAQVRMLGSKTVLGDAIGVAINLFEQSDVDERVLIVLTDGNDTGSLVPPQRAAEIARDNGVVVHPVAMGDPAAAGEQALDEDAMRQIATTTGGRYFHAADRVELESIYTSLDRLNPKQVETRSYRPELNLFHLPLAAVVVISLLFFGGYEARALLHRRNQAVVVEPDGREEALS